MRRLLILPTIRTSRPTRGAWIEIQLEDYESWYSRVAPHTGRVD